jgi:hypothetical protein
MNVENTIWKTSKIMLLFSIIYYLWATVSISALRAEFISVPLIGQYLAGPQPPAWFATFNSTYYKAVSNLTAIRDDSVSKGTEYSLHDLSVKIIVQSNGTVLINESEHTNDSRVMLFYFYNRVGWKFACINSQFLNKQICPTDYANFSAQYTEGASKTAQKSQTVVFVLPMTLDGNLGNTTSYSYSSSPTDDYLYSLLNTNAPAIYQIRDDYENSSAVVDFGIKSPKCINVTIPRWRIITFNITMPSDITSSDYPKEYANKVVISKNNAVFVFNPYPCCGIPETGKRDLEVCS